MGALILHGLTPGKPMLLYYLQRPASMVLIALIFITVIFPMIKAAVSYVKARKHA